MNHLYVLLVCASSPEAAVLHNSTAYREVEQILLHVIGRCYRRHQALKSGYGQPYCAVKRWHDFDVAQGRHEKARQARPPGFGTGRPDHNSVSNGPAPHTR
jgi:hypothetical protein